MDGLVSRVASGSEDHELIAKLLLRMYAEVGRAPLNLRKASMEIVDTVENHAAYLVEHHGVAVATAGIMPFSMFYTDAPFLIDKWFYIAESHRGKGIHGAVLKRLFSELKILCDTSGMPCFIRVFNEKRTMVRDEIDRVGRAYCCYPAGATIEIGKKR